MVPPNVPDNDALAGRYTRLTQQLEAAADPDQVASALAEAARLNPECTVAVHVAGSGGGLRLAAFQGPGAGPANCDQCDPTLSLSALAARTGEVVVCTDVTADPRTASVRRWGLATGSAVALPIRVGQEVWGVLTALFGEPAPPPLVAMAALTAMAGLAGLSAGQYQLRRTTEQQVRYLLASHEVSRLLASTLDTDAILNLMVDVATGLLDLDLCCFFRPDPTGLLQVAVARGLDPDTAKQIALPPGAVPDPGELGAPAAQIAEILTVPGRRRPMGYLAVGRSAAALQEGEQRLLGTWLGLVGLALDNDLLRQQVRSAERGAVLALSGILSARFSGYRTHARQVAELAMDMARRLRLPEADVEDLELAALIHDVGYLVTLAGSSTVALHHAVAGADLLEDIGGMARLAPLVRHHHEQWDGGGPGGLVGEQLPAGARILAVAEAYAGYREGRANRPPLNAAAAWIALRGQAGQAFDPRVTAALESAVWERLNLLPPNEAAPAADPESAGGAHPGSAAAGLDLSPLTTREQEVLHLIAQGLNNREIATRLYLSEATVKTHVSRILHKLDLPDRTKAAVYLLRSRRSGSA